MPKKELETLDTGIVIYDVNTKQYWCNQNSWSPLLRKAEIYHSMHYVDQVIKKFPNKNLETAIVTISIV